ncbi:MAG: DMT family transporter [Alphaproteobacteria bacterium]|nr:DMT family transporter [Alphaproteobacteria bacterium]
MPMSPSLSRTTVLAYLSLTGAMFLWGSNVVAARLSVIDMPPIGVSFWRWVTVVVVLLPFTWREIVHAWPTLRAYWRMLVTLAILGPVIFNALVYVGLQTTTAINSAIANGTAPAATVLAAYLITRETVAWQTAFGMAAAFVGVLVIIARGDPAVLATLTVREGDILILLAVVSWGTYTVLLKYRPPGLSSLALVAVLMVIGVAAFAPLYAWEMSRGRFIAITPSNLALIIYAGAVISVFANLLFIRGILAIGSSAAGQFNNLIPIFGSALSVLFLDEAFELYHLAGMVFVLAGVYWAAEATTRT